MTVNLNIKLEVPDQLQQVTDPELRQWLYDLYVKNPSYYYLKMMESIERTLSEMPKQKDEETDEKYRQLLVAAVDEYKVLLKMTEEVEWSFTRE